MQAKLVPKLVESGDRIRATREAVNEESIHLRDRNKTRKVGGADVVNQSVDVMVK